MSQLLHLFTVVAAQILLLVLPPWLVARRLMRGGDWPAVALAAIILSFAVQGTAGLVWNHWIARAPRLEAVLYVVFWLGASLICFRRRQGETVEARTIDSLESMGLAGILLLALVVRSIHPLQHWALGQSDAYSHLQFIQDVVDKGQIRNRFYPPGYSWTLGLPALVFPLDQYYVARYGGAFFGATLVLAVYVLARAFASKPTAIFAAFLAAAFPGLQLLLKTGVGAFANQMGLCLIPSALLFYFRWRSQGFASSADALLLAAALLALAAAVPLMLVHVMLLLMLERLAALLIDRKQWALFCARIALAALPALAIAGLHLFHVNEDVRIESARIMVNADASHAGQNSSVVEQSAREKEANAAGIQPAWLLMTKDFCSFKRAGYGTAVLNIPAVLLSLVFLAYLIAGIRGKSLFALLLGLWGVLASVQAHTGFLQFSNYQREGWSLLIATACVGGHVASVIYDWGFRWPLFKGACAALMLASAVCCFILPPGHTVFSSPAEDDIIRLVRTLAGKESAAAWKPGFDAVTKLEVRLPILLVARRFAGFKYGQGDLVLAVKGNLDSVTCTGDQSLPEIFVAGRQYVVLLDREDGKELIGHEVMLHLNPGLSRAFLSERAAALQLNSSLEKYIEGLDRTAWKVDRCRIGDNLDVVVVSWISQTRPAEAKEERNHGLHCLPEPTLACPGGSARGVGQGLHG